MINLHSKLDDHSFLPSHLPFELLKKGTLRKKNGSGSYPAYIARQEGQYFIWYKSKKLFSSGDEWAIGWSESFKTEEALLSFLEYKEWEFILSHDEDDHGNAW